MSFRDKIDALRAEYNLSIREVADRCEVEVTTFQSMYSRNVCNNIEAAKAICRYFKLDFEEFCDYAPEHTHEIPMGNLRFNHATREWEVRFPHMARGPFYKNVFVSEAEARAAIRGYYEGTYDPSGQSAWAKHVEQAARRLNEPKPRAKTAFNHYRKDRQ